MSLLSLICFLWISQLPLLSFLKLVRVHVPEEVRFSGKALLACHFQLDPGQEVDSIKWYRNNTEIYRIMPGQKKLLDRVIVFPTPGMEIDLPMSGLYKYNTHHLSINNIERGGNFVCQVTENRAPFHTEELGGYLSVLVLPSSGPYLSGLKLEYRTGENINVQCHSHPSFPQTNFTFYINQRKVEPSSIIVTSVPHSNLMTSTASIVVPVSGKLLSSPSVRIRCSASLGRTYREEVVGVATVATPTQVLHSVPLTSNTRALNPIFISCLSGLVVLVALMDINKI